MSDLMPQLPKTIKWLAAIAVIVIIGLIVWAAMK